MTNVELHGHVCYARMKPPKIKRNVAIYRIIFDRCKETRLWANIIHRPQRRFLE